MRYALIIVLALGIFAGAAQAGSNQNLCAKNYPNVQSASGGTFASVAECASSKGGVFSPSISAPSVLTAGQPFNVTGAGFHGSTGITLTFAITGQTPYWSGLYGTTADGSSLAIFGAYASCTGTYDLTLTLTDSFGVHASARMTLC